MRARHDTRKRVWLIGIGLCWWSVCVPVFVYAHVEVDLRLGDPP